MSFWSRALGAVGIRKRVGDVAVDGDRIVLRELDRAKVLPQEPKESGRKAIEACAKCAGPLRQVVFTTAGSGEQVEIWRQYPLAVDGWRCLGCGWSAVPRFISPEESVEYGRNGAEHVAHGQFDDAEFWFRRIIASWPGYAAGYADMGQLSLARSEAASSPEAKQRYRREAETWFRRAVDADHDRRLLRVRVPLARVLALSGNESEALALLDTLLDDSSVPAAVQNEAEALTAEIRAGKGLFTRATELAQGLVLEPASKPLVPADRRALEHARVLLREASQRESAFATSWFLGKLEMRLGNMDAALANLQRAHSINPDQPDGCRELCSAYLELDRAQDALPLARRASELRPTDTTLRCNLAFVLLLNGELDDARAHATAALSADPNDAITRNVLKLIDDVSTGRRPQPTSLAEAEGRRR